MDSTYEQLAERNAELESEKARLLDENERLRVRLLEVRIYVGDNMPARQGLTVVHMLERAMSGGE